MRLPTLKSPVARAVAPVVAGIAAFALIGLALWGVSLAVSHNSGVKVNTALAGRYFKPGGAERLARLITKDGPLLFPSLVGDAGRKPIGIGHVGDDPLKGWRVYSLVPPGASPDCILALDQSTRELTAPCAPGAETSGSTIIAFRMNPCGDRSMPFNTAASSDVKLKKVNS